MPQQQQNSLHLFEAILSQMRETYIRKNADYGDSFKETMDEYGLTALTLRLTDKLNRLKTLSKGDEPSVHGEPILDTILDIANYAVLGAMYAVSLTKDGEIPDAAKGIRGKATLANYYQAVNELNKWFEEASKTKDRQKANIAANILNSLLPFVKSVDYPLDEETRRDTLMAMQNMAVVLNDILGTKKVMAEPVDDDTCGIDTQLLYDYQTLCVFSQHPTEEGLQEAYKVAMRIMDTEVTKGGNKQFVNDAITLAQEVIDAYNERLAPKGVVVPFSPAKE